MNITKKTAQVLFSTIETDAIQACTHFQKLQRNNNHWLKIQQIQFKYVLGLCNRFGFKTTEHLGSRYSIYLQMSFPEIPLQPQRTSVEARKKIQLLKNKLQGGAILSNNDILRVFVVLLLILF